MKPDNETIALELVEDTEKSFEDFAAVIKKYNMTEDDVCEVFDWIESWFPHATFSNVDSILALAA